MIHPEKVSLIGLRLCLACQKALASASLGVWEDLYALRSFPDSLVGAVPQVQQTLLFKAHFSLGLGFFLSETLLEGSLAHWMFTILGLVGTSSQALTSQIRKDEVLGVPGSWESMGQLLLMAADVGHLMGVASK